MDVITHDAWSGVDFALETNTQLRNRSHQLLQPLCSAHVPLDLGKKTRYYAVERKLHACIVA
jgi:hypothetical protein